jgi:acid phosphatase type 7
VALTNRIARPFAIFLVLVLLAAILAAGKVSTATPIFGDIQPALPLRAAFYYAWFPEAWNQQHISPYTNYHPSLGYYSSPEPAVIQQHIAAMQYGGIQAGIASWWGQGSRTDNRLPTLLATTAGSTFRWSVYYEQESQGDPSVDALTADLTYLRDHYGSDPSYLRIDGRFVVFVYADGADGCAMADRWKQANSLNAYIVLKVFAGYRNCASQPDGWHQYAPAVAADSQGTYSYAISPGFNKVGESPRLARDLARWKSNVRAMVASGAAFQLVTTFNEWGEGTAVESAQEWTSASGYGAYLDALHTNGLDTAPATATPQTQVPITSTPTQTPPASTTGSSPLLFTVDADARVVEANPAANYGTATSLQVDGASDPDQESYLRFTVSDVPGPVQSTKLRVYDTTNGSKNGPAVYATGTEWSEAGLTWNNRPARASDVLDNKGAFGTSSWVEYNVTSLVSGNGTYSFVLVADSSDGVKFSSREGGAPPQLVLTLVPGSAASPTPTNPPDPTTALPTAAPTTTPLPSSADPVLIGAGDIASCNSTGDEATAALLDGIAGTVITLGDNVYDSGTPAEFTNCYDPSWGRAKARTRPAVGNHEYGTSGAAGYFGYFGAAAGDSRTGYYSYDLGTWHIIVINSNCSKVGGCQAGSSQEQWLRADLAAHSASCTLAYWHHPRFSSGEHGSATALQPIWQALYDANADVVLNGHDHNYERFAPQNPSGTLDKARGIRQFIVGTGGKNHYQITAPITNSEVYNNATFGVLKLTLHPTSYDWEFIAEAGKTFSDTGNADCH